MPRRLRSDRQPRFDLVAGMKYPWMPLFWGDFLANTMHLSAQEAGAYLFLIAHAWEHEGEIPGDRVRLARIAHVRHDRWKEVWKVLEPFFERNAVGPVITGTSDHGYHHERVTDELHRLGKIASNRKAAAEQMLSKRSASAQQNTPQVTPYPTSTSNRESSLNGKGREAPTAQVAPPAPVNYRDPGVDYRSPPRAKSDNALQPLTDKPPRSSPKGVADEQDLETVLAALHNGGG